LDVLTLLRGETELFQVTAHLRPDCGQLGFEVVDFLLNGGEVDDGRFLEGIDVAGDVQVVVVFPDPPRTPACPVRKRVFPDARDVRLSGDPRLQALSSSARNRNQGYGFGGSDC
jgi:hypothetical protein